MRFGCLHKICSVVLLLDAKISLYRVSQNSHNGPILLLSASIKIPKLTVQWKSVIYHFELCNMKAQRAEIFLAVDFFQRGKCNNHTIYCKFWDRCRTFGHPVLVVCSVTIIIYLELWVPLYMYLQLSIAIHIHMQLYLVLKLPTYFKVLQYKLTLLPSHGIIYVQN